METIRFDNELVKRKIELSHKEKHPCMWEKGGQVDDSNGSSTIICDKFGNPLVPIFVKKSRRICSEHALFVVHKDYIIVEVSFSENSPLDINILRLVELCYEEGYVLAEIVQKLSFPFSTDKDIDEAEEKITIFCETNSKIKLYKNAVVAAYKKATTFECDRLFFARNCNRIHYKYSY